MKLMKDFKDDMNIFTVMSEILKLWIVRHLEIEISPEKTLVTCQHI